MDKKLIPSPFNLSFNVIKHSLVESLFPQVRNCLFCGGRILGNRLSAGLCPQCLLDWLRLRQNAVICPFCGSFDSGQPCRGPCGGRREIGKMASLDSTSAAVPYTGLYRQQMMAFKYNGRRELALPMGFLMSKTWEARGRQLPTDTGLCLVPVPMHQAKEAARGYNQSRLLAEVISRQLKLPVQELLWRPLPGQVQAGLDKKQRRQVLDQVFQWAGAEAGIKTASPRSGKRRYSAVILVDDVVTTGATLESCGQILRQQGYNPIWGLTFAGGSGSGIKYPLKT
ncbi:MAG: hypothetical protein AAGU12_07590 [Clostridiales bacterium]